VVLIVGAVVGDYFYLVRSSNDNTIGHLQTSGRR